MKNILNYRTRSVFLDDVDSMKDKFPGLEKFAHYFKIYSNDVAPYDRTGIIKYPLNVINAFPMPKLREFTKTYEEICNERAKELLKKSDDLEVPIKVMYSGGIDSTLIVISFLKNASEEQKKKITVLLSEDSILENPRFYEEHILGKLNIEPSLNFPFLLGKKDQILVLGEHNDQVFGSDIIGVFIRRYSEETIFKDYNREMIVDFFNKLNGKVELNNFCFDLLDELCKKAPVKIKTVFDFFWWINFACKWQCVYFRSIMYVDTANRDLINKEYIDNYYYTFYGTEDFQLWSMANMDKKIKDTWKSYKFPAKEIIFAFNKDEDYFQNKTKVGSLPRVVAEYSPLLYIDENYRSVEHLDFAEVYNKDNSFI
jgi:hypothetical protein